MEIFKNDKYELSIDEAGRGPLFGPVVAGAIVWGDAPDSDLIKDSKKLSKKKRKEALKWIKENVKEYAVGIATSKEIDEINILEATKLAMKRAIEKIKNKKELIIDGKGWDDCFNIPTESIIKGDNKYKNIAAASILAKETHDNLIRELCENNDFDEKYDLLKNMGYGTKNHLTGIKNYGYSEGHRKSFKIKNKK
jgi:ribonuclease HII